MTEALNQDIPEQAHDTPQQPSELVLAFNGSTQEYFRIWIVNLCLTLLTLGVFSAWAKVRKKRYFYSQTTLDGTPFQYLGQPIPIFKGRLIAAAFFFIYYASSHFFTSLFPYVLVAGTALAPWVIIRSAAFNSRYSAFRNMTFHYNGGYLDALKVLFSWGLLPIFVIGTIFGWGEQYELASIPLLIFGLVFPWWIRRFKNLIISHSSYGGISGGFTATGTQFFKVYFVAGLIVIAFVSIAVILVGVILYSLTHRFDLLFLIMIPSYAGYVLGYAYVQALGTNLVWNHTRLGPLRFHSTLPVGGMAKLYFTSALII